MNRLLLIILMFSFFASCKKETIYVDKIVEKTVEVEVEVEVDPRPLPSELKTFLKDNKQLYDSWIQSITEVSDLAIISYGKNVVYKNVIHGDQTSTNCITFVGYVFNEDGMLSIETHAYLKISDGTNIDLPYPLPDIARINTQLYNEDQFVFEVHKKTN